MYVEVGPASLVITGEKRGVPFLFLREEIEELVRSILRDIRECLPILRQKAYRIKNVSHLPEVAKRMTEAVKLVDENNLTPMAAVAGAVADMVKEHFAMQDLDLLTVNNGGDLSLFNKTGRPLRVGIGNIISGKPTPYVMILDGVHDLGMATSGFGGRSLTLGLADTVTAVAKTAVLADAAATHICNRTNVETDLAVREKARLIDPGTDIPEEDVTVAVGSLSPELVARALGCGLTAANALRERTIIEYAAIALKEGIATTVNGNKTKSITLEVQDGNQEDHYHC
ncbi:MAG: hypothetical protein PHC90_00835 [Syntrophorhabdaceae bacterium]|nr:hypothetical protein [Syntrophorhabdaceae bacterium]